MKSSHFLRTLQILRIIRILWSPLCWWFSSVWPFSQSHVWCHIHMDFPIHLSSSSLLSMCWRSQSSPPDLFSLCTHSLSPPLAHVLKYQPQADVLVADVTIHKQLSGLKQKTLFPHSSENQKFKIGVIDLKSKSLQSHAASGGTPQGESFPCPCWFLGLPAFLGLWLHPYIFSSLVTLPPPLLWVGNLPLPLQQEYLWRYFGST